MKNILSKLRNFGPGLIWGIAAIGSGELVISTKVGSEYGFAFIWILWLGVFLDFWLQRGIMEVTLLTGKPVINLWESKKWGWGVSVFWLIYFLVMIGGMAGLIGLTASAFNSLFPFLSRGVLAVLAILLTGFVFYRGKYKFFERLMLVFGGVLFLGVIIATFSAPPSVDQVFSWGLPKTKAAFFVFLALLGWSAGSGPELMIPYSFWLLEKDGNKDLIKKKKEKEVRSKLKIMRLDAMGGFLAVAITASVFLSAGAVILGPEGVSLDGFEIVGAISMIFTKILGSWAYWVFMASMAAAFIGASAGIFNGVCSSIIYLLNSIFGNRRSFSNKIKSDGGKLTIAILFGLISLSIFFFVSNPVFLVALAGAASALATPVLFVFIIWALLKKIPKEYRPKKFYQTILFLGFSLHVILLGATIWQLFI